MRISILLAGTARFARRGAGLRLHIHHGSRMSDIRESPDPVLDAWLRFLEREIAGQPEHIKPLSADSLARARALVGDIAVDLDEDLGDDFTLGSTEIA